MQGTAPECSTPARRRGKCGLRACSRECLNQRHRSDRAADHAEHRRTPDLVPRRQMREPHFDEVEIVLNPVEIAAIRLCQTTVDQSFRGIVNVASGQFQKKIHD